MPRSRYRFRVGRAALVLSLFVGGAGLVLWLFRRDIRFSPPPAPAPEVEYDGCAAVFTPGPVCVLAASRELRLWVGLPPSAGLEVRADGATVATAGETVRGGRRFLLSVPPKTKRIEVAAGGRAPWLLAVAEPDGKPPPGAKDMLAEVKAQATAFYVSMRAGDLGAMRRALEHALPPPAAPAVWKYNLRFSGAQLAEREGDYRMALEKAQAAVEIADRVKADRLLWFGQQELAMVRLGVGRAGESVQLFEHLRQHPEAAKACEIGELLNNEAWAELLARETGERLGDPVRMLERALEVYETCGATAEKKVNTIINLALAHMQESRFGAAKELLAKARVLEPHPPLPHRLWWLDLEGRLSLQEGRLAAARRAFAELDDLAQQTGFYDARLRALFGEARVDQTLGQPAKALERLLAAERVLDAQSLQVPIYEGRAWFVAARRSIVSLHLELLLDRGRTAEALETARSARARLLRQLAHVGRLSSLPPAQRDRRAHLLSEFQRKRAALEARAQNDWKLPADELRHEEAARRAEAEAAERLLDEAFLVLGEPVDRQPTPPGPVRRGELLLAYHPLGTAWVGFAADDEGVLAHRFELPADALAQPTVLAARLLLPFRSRIERAQLVRVLASGRLEGVDFHALPFGGDVLAAGRPVVYALDLAAAQLPKPAARKRALLVADPRGDLPGAAAEAAAVRKALQSDRPPWTTEELAADEASAAAVGRRLGGVDLFHYAGHGSFAGFGGWDSSLLLAKDTRLTLGDLLAVDSPPRWVVLSGCETGRSTAQTPVAELGLAHAFVLAGSQAVVASTRPTDDKSLPVFFAELYRRWQPDTNLAVALQLAQLEWRRQDPQADWASFRLFQP